MSSEPAGLTGPDVLAVVVPAHNEARLIGRCLASLQASAEQLRRSVIDPPEVQLVVVLDACTDATDRAVAGVPGVRTVRVDEHRVGAARRAGAEAVLAMAPGTSGRTDRMRQPDGRRVWLASTDADTAVPAHWLCGMVQLARGGADLVLGTVEPGRGLPAEVLRRWQSGYHSGDGHRHVHGANLGISGAAYRLLGGWPATAIDEDVVLVRRAEAAGLNIVRTGALRVCTSSRRTGRAPGGFAEYLATLARPADALVG